MDLQEQTGFPIEVKSGANTTSKSLKKFKELFSAQVKLRIRFSLDNLKLDNDVLNIPLFMAGQTDRIIGLAFGATEITHYRLTTPSMTASLQSVFPR